MPAPAPPPVPAPAPAPAPTPGRPEKMGIWVRGFTSQCAQRCVVFVQLPVHRGTSRLDELDHAQGLKRRK